MKILHRSEDMFLQSYRWTSTTVEQIIVATVSIDGHTDLLSTNLPSLGRITGLVGSDHLIKAS